MSFACRLVSILSLILLAAIGFGADNSCTQATVIGNAKTDFASYGVVGNIFSQQEVCKNTAQTRQKLNESLDNSMLVVLDSTKPETYKVLFDNRSIRESLKQLLKRGGMLYFGVTDWNTLKHQPKGLLLFLKEIGAWRMKASDYYGDKPDTYSAGVMNPDSPTPFTSQPKRLEGNWKGGMAIRFIRNYPASVRPILVESSGRRRTIATLEEKILGKGYVLHNFSYTTLKNAKNDFMENILTGLYGERRQLSAREVMQKRLGNAASSSAEPTTTALPEFLAMATRTHQEPLIDGTIDLAWEKAVELTLMEAKTGHSVSSKTKVRLLFDDDNFYLLAESVLPIGLDPVVKVTERDGRIWTDESVEFILSGPDQSSPKFHFMVNAASVSYDSRESNAGWNSSLKAASSRTAEGWNAELAIPFADLEATPEEQPVWRFNICRNSPGQNMLSSWSPIPNGFQDPLSTGWLSFVPKARLSALLPKSVKARAKPLYDNGFMAWEINPFVRTFAETVPEKISPAKKLQIVAARNQKRSVALMLTNFTDRGITLRLEPQYWLETDQGKIAFDHVFSFSQAVPRLSPYKQRQNDPLVSLGSGNLITIPGFESRQVWINSKSGADLPAGEYDWSLQLITVDSEWPDRTIDVKLTLLPLVFPDRMPFPVYYFGPYGFSFARGEHLKEAYIRGGAEYYQNWFYTSLPLKAIRKEGDRIVVSDDAADYDSGEDLLSRYGNWIYGYGIHSEFNQHLEKLGFAGKMHDEEWRRIFTRWLQVWFACLKQRGYGFDRFYIPVIDEIRDEDTEEVYRTQEIIKQTYPDARLYHDPATWTSLSTIRRLAPLTDLFIAWENRLTGRPESAEELEFYQKRGKPFWTYLCSINTQVLPLMNYYRMRGIRNFLYGQHGVALWSFNSWQGNSWDEWDKHNKSGDNCLFYHGDKGPVPSIRAEALRVALEDFYLLHLARKRLKESADRDLANMISRKRLKELCDRNDPEELSRWRTELLQKLY